MELAEQHRISETLQDNLVDAVPSQAMNTPLSSTELPGQAGSPAVGIIHQGMGEHITTNLFPKKQRRSRPKGGYDDPNRTLAPVTDDTRIVSDADDCPHDEAPPGISSDISNSLNRAGQVSPRRQSLPARLSGPKRHVSSTSTITSSIASSTRSNSLWKKWRSWKLVLVDKNSSNRDLSDGPQNLSLSSVNGITNHPVEVEQASLDSIFSSPHMQPAHETTPAHNLPEISRVEEDEESKARFSVQIVPQTQVQQSPRSAKEESGMETSRGGTAIKAAVNVPAAAPRQFSWVTTLPLDETLPDSKVTSFKTGGDDSDELTDSTDSNRDKKIKKIQIVISFDEVADLVIDAHLKGKKPTQ